MDKNDAEVKIIDSSSKRIEEKCFDMLEKWLETSSNPCYEDLIKALEEHKLYEASEKVKMQAATERDLISYTHYLCAVFVIVCIASYIDIRKDC